MNYIPIFKYKERIDITAYNFLNLNKDKNITPLIELFQEDKIEMNKIDANKIFYLSMLIEKNMQFHNSVDFFLDVKNRHPNIIPVINSDYNFDDKKSSFKSAKKLFNNFNKVAIKINGIKDMFIRENFENILLSVVNDYKSLEVFLDVDFAYKFSKEQIISYTNNAIDYFLNEIDSEICNFTITGSIVKVSSLGLDDFSNKEKKCNTIANNLFSAYKEIKKSHNILNIKYSDYTIDEKHMFIDYNVGGGSFYPAIKFTQNNGDVCIYKSAKLSEFNDYIKIAKIISNESFFNSSHCCGCQYISNIAHGLTNGKGTGNPSTWKTNMMCHHVKTMASIT